MWELTEGDDGRWYGRGTADCKGNVVVHLTALRALKAVDGSFPVNIKLIVEGSEEQGTGGLEAYVPPNADSLRADTICVGRPTSVRSPPRLGTVRYGWRQPPSIVRSVDGLRTGKADLWAGMCAR